MKIYIVTGDLPIKAFFKEEDAHIYVREYCNKQVVKDWLIRPVEVVDGGSGQLETEVSPKIFEKFTENPLRSELCKLIEAYVYVNSRDLNIEFNYQEGIDAIIRFFNKKLGLTFGITCAALSAPNVSELINLNK